mgnify:CR=1 FL=1
MTDMISFNNKEEFFEHFQKMADESEEELTDDFCIEGNSGTTFGWLKNIAEKIGYDKISVSADTDYTAYVDIDVSNAPSCSFDCNSDDTRYCNGIISLWWD